MKCETRECNNNDNGTCYYGEQAKNCPRLSCTVQPLVGNQVQLSAKDQLEWIWDNCRITYQDVVENYPIEHCKWAKKDSRAFIEAQMPNDNHQPEQA